MCCGFDDLCGALCLYVCKHVSESEFCLCIMHLGIKKKSRHSRGYGAIPLRSV